MNSISKINYIFEQGKITTPVIVDGITFNTADDYLRHQFLEMYKHDTGYFLNENTLDFWQSFDLTLDDPNPTVNINELINFLDNSSYSSDFLSFIKSEI